MQLSAFQIKFTLLELWLFFSLMYLNLLQLFVDFMSIERYGDQRKVSCLIAILKRTTALIHLLLKSDQERNKIVGHLPREISRITKFFLDRNAVVTTELTSSHYRRSPLVQGGLEIRSKVTVKVDSSFNTKVVDRYKAKVKELYIEPTDEEILGSFLLEEELASTLRKSRCNDIRNFFTHARNVKSTFNQGQGKNIIEID